MSASAHTAYLDERPRGVARREHARATSPDRPLLRLATFTALAAYALVRWAELITPAPGWRLFGLLALSVTVAGVGPWLRGLSGPAALALAVAVVIVVFPVTGIPLSWVRHVRIAVIADGIGQGLSALPGVLLPYAGINQWVRVVVLLGAAVLLLDSAFVLTFAPRALGELRRASAALPLVALAIVPATLVRPKSPYLQGLLLFALLAAFMWGERLRRPAAASALGVAAAAATVAMVLAPALDTHQAWFNYRAWAGTFASGRVDSFNWTQTYGPLRWPRLDRDVFNVRAKTGDYWKAENLETFDGVAWTGAPLPDEPVLPSPTLVSLERWTQEMQVMIRGMKTLDVIGAGASSGAVDVPGNTRQGASLGTLRAGQVLGPGVSYRVTAYSPHPSTHQLQTAGGAYPLRLLGGYLTIGLPGTKLAVGPAAQVSFPFFHSGLPIQSLGGAEGNDGTRAVEASPYARAYALAQRLAGRARTPFQFVTSVQNYLSHGFAYNERPPVRRFPLESFLFQDKRGYCQQFSGAMALLLRMGGLPARVAAGFTTGAYNGTAHQWVVSDRDAHAWVEVWFPRYGWVRFDPTPSVAPARNGTLAAPHLKGDLTGARGLGAAPNKTAAAAPIAPVAKRSVSSGGGFSVLPTIVAIALLSLLGLLSRARLLAPEPTGEELVMELERALARSGRPLAGGVTLTTLERRFRSSPAAAAYIRQVRLSRFAGSAEAPSQSGRRALRATLGAGLGPVGRLRALWALPPRFKRSRAGQGSA
jgi:Transglutaminase-like superfamily/TgpA N-terminal domain